MYVFRFMSEKEFAMVTSGCDVVGKRHYKARTNSSGVCFLPEIVNFISHGKEFAYSPEQCFEFLSGIVSDDVLVKFEVINAEFTKSYGIYADPEDYDWFARIKIDELCIPKYNREMLKPVGYAIIEDWFEWKWYKYEG